MLESLLHSRSWFPQDVSLAAWVSSSFLGGTSYTNSSLSCSVGGFSKDGTRDKSLGGLETSREWDFGMSYNEEAGLFLLISGEHKILVSVGWLQMVLGDRVL